MAKGTKSDPFPKDPQAVLNFSVDWSKRYPGETVSASTWAVPSGVTEETSSFDGLVCTILLSGGTVGSKYALTNHIEMAGGMIDESTIYVRVREG